MPDTSIVYADVAVIGAGTAGHAAFRAARKSGAKALLIGEPPLGTTCARVGCMPSKVLLSAAKKMEAARKLERFMNDGQKMPALDTVKIMDDVRAKRDHFVQSVIDGMDAFDDGELLLGRGRFLDAHRLEVSLDDGGVRAVTANRFVIATGSSPIVLPGFEGKPNVITTDELFELARLPNKPIIIGDGAIALECAYALSRLGSDVTLLGHGGTIGGLSDEDVDTAARQALLEPLHFVPDQSDLSLVHADDASVGVEFTHEGRRERLEGNVVLLAVGRKPNVTDLNLQALDLDCDDSGIPLTDPFTGQTSLKHIALAGDATGTDTILHVASSEGQHTGENSVRETSRAAMAQTAMRLVFTEPGIGLVGMTRQQLDDKERPYVVGGVDFSEQGRAMAEDRNAGRLHIYACPKTGSILGAEMVTPDAEHLSHLIAAAITARWSVDDFLAMPFYHPTVEEGLKTALRDARHELRYADQPLPQSLDIAAGC